MMHYWGDEWFCKYGDQLDEAIKKLNTGLNQVHVHCCGKEKYGCFRTDFFSLWNGSIRCWNGKWNNYITPAMPELRQLWMRICIYLDNLIIKINKLFGITKRVQEWQKAEINRLFQTVCKEYPEITDELINETDCYMYIKPGKYGDIDGEKIHNKYWKQI